MKVYLVIIYLSAGPMMFSGSYMEVDSMKQCWHLANKFNSDDYYRSHRQTFFCSQGKVEGHGKKALFDGKDWGGK